MDGHDIEAINKAFHEASTFKGKPTALVCKTLKGSCYTTSCGGGEVCVCAWYGGGERGGVGVGRRGGVGVVWGWGGGEVWVWCGGGEEGRCVHGMGVGGGEVCVWGLCASSYWFAH